MVMFLQYRIYAHKGEGRFDTGVQLYAGICAIAYLMAYTVSWKSYNTERWIYVFSIPGALGQGVQSGAGPWSHDGRWAVIPCTDRTDRGCLDHSTGLRLQHLGDSGVFAVRGGNGFSYQSCCDLFKC